MNLPAPSVYERKQAVKELIEKLRSVKGIGLLVLGLAAGIILLILGNQAGKNSETASVKEDFSFEAYEKALSERLEEMIDKVDGVSGVHVMLTLERGYSESLAKDGDDYLTLKQSDGGQETVTIFREAPEVKGVAVICKGGDDPEIQKEIIEMLCALFHLSSNRIFVSGG